MSKQKLDKEEKVILDSYNRGEWISIRNKKSINKFRTAARKTTIKKKPLCN